MGRPAPATRVREPRGPAHSGHSPADCCDSSPGTVRRFIPLDHRQEMRELFKLAGPVIISQFMVFMISIISMVFCGHLGKTELAGVSLAAAVVNVSGISIGTGLSSTCDTLISQTYGSGNLKRVGVILQRGILILLLACFPCWAVLINTEPLLLAVKQSPGVASLSQLYVKIFMPALPAVFMYQLQGKYLQNQGIMWPQVITGAAGNIINVIVNYIFLYPLEWGVAGSAAANAISQYLLALFLYVYICWKGLHKATWGGWSLDCLQEWGPFVKLAIPSMLMICLSWWIFEIGGFLAGVINEVELGAQSIAYQLCIAAYMFPMGFSVAASVRVGNALGSGNTKQAKLSCKVPIMCAFIVACFVGASLSIARNVIGYIFTSEQEIIKRVADVMLLFGFMHIGDATAGVAAGVLRGAGKQLFGALCNLVALYFIGFPIGVSLMFAAKMGIVGLWTGLSICVSLQVIVFITFLCRLDWKKTTEEALERAGVHITEDKEMVGKEHTDSDQNPSLDSTTISSSVSEEGDTDLEMLLPGHSKFTSTTTVGDVLSVTQLVLRRGLALLIMIIILISGIVSSTFLIISQLMVFLISFVSTVFCGHLGKTELAGVSLSIAVVNVTGISIGSGLSLTCDTFVSQTYGSGNLKRVGVIFQRGILILLLACFPCWAVLINTEPLLLAVQQSPEVARLSQLYVKIFMPALPAAFMYQLQGKYLQNQGIIWPQVITGVIANVLNAIINYFFIYYLDWGVAGSAAANAISQFVLAVVLFAYIYCRGLHKATWGGWSLECLQEWGPFVRLAIPSMLMLCLEWWMFEIGGFLAGVISEAELGAQSIAYELSTIAFMFPQGISAAASVRVGNAVGAGNIEQAKLSSKISIICAFIIACFVGVSVALSKDVVGHIFTSEQDILERVSKVMLIFGFMHLVDAIAGVTGGVLRGAGKQMIGALCNLVGYYFIGFPIGVSLMFAVHMGIEGLWTGLTVCVLMQSIFFITYICKLDWNKAVKEALRRAGVQVKEEKEMVRMENTGSTMSVILDLPYVYSAWVSSAVAIIYTLLGGLYSVAYTDIIQLSLTFLSLWLCVPFLLLSPTSTNIAQTAFNHTFQEPWVGTLDQDKVWAWTDDFLMLALGSVSFQCFHQRTLSASSSRTAQFTCYIAAVVIAILGVPPVLVGAVAASTDWNKTLYGSPPPYVRGEQSLVLPLTLQYLTPSYISVIGIGAVAAAVMSSTDSALLSAASVFSSNIYKNILRQQASDYEMQWVIRVTVVAVGVVGTSITFFTNSTLVLWILGADVSYSLIFPHLVSVLFSKVTNGYGALVGYIIGLTLRISLGERAVGLPVVLCLPGCTMTDGVFIQKSPVPSPQTLITIQVFSLLALVMFNHGLLPERWDIFKVKNTITVSPTGAVTQNDNDEAGSDEECDKNRDGLGLQPVLQAG